MRLNISTRISQAAFLGRHQRHLLLSVCSNLKNYEFLLELALERAGHAPPLCVLLWPRWLIAPSEVVNTLPVQRTSERQSNTYERRAAKPIPANIPTLNHRES